MIRRVLPVLLAVLFLALPAGAQEWGETATPVSPVNLRQSRDLNSPSRDVLMPGEVVRVDFLRDGWYAVFRLTEKTRDESRALGYARAGFFKPALAGAAVSTAESPSSAAHPTMGAVKPPVPASDSGATAKEVAPAISTPPREEKPIPRAPMAAFTPLETAPPVQTAAHHSGAWGELRSADRQLAVRAKRDPDSEHVRTLKPGEVVKVDFLRDGWFAVFPPDAPVRDESRAIGYSKARFLLPAGKNVTLAPIEPVRPLPVPSKSRPGSEEPRLEPATPPMSLMNSTNWGQALTTKNKVALSRSPSVHAGHARTLERGTPVRVEDVGQNWYAVYSPSETAPDPAKAWGYATRAELDGQAEDSPKTTIPPSPAAASISPSEAPPRPAGPDLTPAPAPPTTAPASSSSAVAAKPQAPSVQAPVAKGLTNPFTPRRPEMPVADSTLHGYRYKILESEEDRVGDVAVIEVKVFLDVTVLPEPEALKDFSRSIWRQKRQAGRDVVLDIFLPDMNPNGLAYAVAHFDPRGELEFWLRRTMLFGTRFSP